MRGVPRCNLTLPNTFNISLVAACPSMHDIEAEQASMRITATLTADSTSAQWYRFGVDVGRLAWVRLWVDDHRLVDQWSGPHPPSPITPALLPNVSLSSSRPVALRLDVRPWASWAALNLTWQTSADGSPRAVPASQLVPNVSSAQRARRALQERAASGWRPWARHSNTAQIVLPQQIGFDFVVRDRSSGLEYTDGGLLRPQLPHGSPPKPPVPVRMGLHAFDGTYSELSFVPFPLGTPRAQPTAALNLTLISATADDADDGATSSSSDSTATTSDRWCVLSSNATTAAEARAANLSLVWRPAAFFGAYAAFRLTGPDAISIDVGELGVLTARFSARPLVAAAGVDEDDATSPSLEFIITETPLVVHLSFSAHPPPTPNATRALEVADQRRSQWQRQMEAAARTCGGLSEAFDALSTAISWNVNFDPRVSVTVPVSRTFEESFDFIFFDWDMYFLSLMAGTRPASLSVASFEIALSNLIEVTQTRSAYGMVMNKRAARGSASSDANDRTEPMVGAMVLERIWQDAKGDATRRAELQWVVELLFPTLLEWHEWAWRERRYGASPLFVLGSDDNLPCEGSTIGLNSSKQHCASLSAAVLESGMDNSPMYYDTFGTGDGATWDAQANRVALYDVQQSALFVSESMALEALAAVSGREDVVPMLQKQRAAVSAAINSELWDDATGIYRQADATRTGTGRARRFSPVLSPTSFYPMIGGVASTAQAQRLVREHLTNVSEFGVDGSVERIEAIGGSYDVTPVSGYFLPSISRSEPSYFDNNYWRGRAWGPLNLLVWLGLTNPAYAGLDSVSRAAASLAAQSHALLMGEWRRHRRVYENYNSSTGEGGDVINANPFYHWGALLGYVPLRQRMAEQSSLPPPPPPKDTTPSLPPHPRLRLNATGWAKLKATVSSNAVAAEYLIALLSYGETLLPQPLVNCSKGADLLTAARLVMDRSYTLGMLYRLTGNRTFATRVVSELLHVTTTCTTWDPFGLALAEMTHGVGIGYDWLFDVLSPAEGSAIVQGAVDLGLREALSKYPKAFWWKAGFNWNVVCNGGLTAGALAFWDEAPDEAAAVLANATVGLPYMFRSFAPDGAWHEGSMYWEYVARYTVVATQSLQTALGTDHGLTRFPGYNETALFRIYMTGPSQTPFNFADSVADARTPFAPTAFLMGLSAPWSSPTTSKAALDVYAFEARRLANFSGSFASNPQRCRYDYSDCAELLLSFNAGAPREGMAALPPSRTFRLSFGHWDNKTALGFFRSSWQPDRSAADGSASALPGTESWLGFKAANGAPNHNDLDGGTFVYETGGRRWAMDLGSDNYQLPGYWTQRTRNGTRYNYYRKASVGHNTLVFDADVMDPCMQRANGCGDAAVGRCAQEPSKDGVGEISLFRAETSSAATTPLEESPGYAIVNLSAAYAHQGATRVERGFAFAKGFERLLVVDEIEFANATNVTWSMHTNSTIALNGSRAVLRQAGDALHVQVLEPAGATFKDVAVDLQPPQLPTPGVRKLIVVTTPHALGPKRRLIVSLSSKDTGAGEVLPVVNELAAWKGLGPFV